NRAIRVDILERLADLIRPALSWRPAMPGEKPAGAFDGRGFTVTVGMTSLAGCSGEHFASILRSLGYRLDRRPPLPAATPTPAPEATASAEPTAIAPDATAETAVAADVPVSEPSPSEETTQSEEPAQPAEPSADTPIELGLGGVE